jgi:hypothetical protein
MNQLLWIKILVLLRATKLYRESRSAASNDLRIGLKYFSRYSRYRSSLETFAVPRATAEASFVLALERCDVAFEFAAKRS